MATMKIQTGIRVEENTLEKLRFIASRQKRSLNNLAEYVLEREIDKFEAEHGVIPLEKEDA